MMQTKLSSSSSLALTVSIPGWRLIICLAAVSMLAIATCEASNVWDGDLEASTKLTKVNYKKQFEKINEFLEEKVATHDLAMNMKKVNEMHSQLLSENLYKSKMIKAVELLLSLGTLEGKAKCNLESYRILLQNDIATGSVAHQNIHESDLGSLNRIQRIIHDASIRHAESCYSRYPELFKEIFYKMDQKMIDQVSLVLDGYIQSQLAPGRESNSQKIYNRFVFQPEAMGVWNFAKNIYETTPDLPKHSPSPNNAMSWLKKKGIDKKKTKQLYRERVLEPCDYYFNQLKGVFIPARYDAVFHKEDDDDEFYMSWARFRLCNGLLSLDRAKLIKQISTIHKEATSNRLDGED